VLFLKKCPRSLTGWKVLGLAFVLTLSTLSLSLSLSLSVHYTDVCVSCNPDVAPFGRFLKWARGVDVVWDLL